jgi:hypothetical protein
VEALPGEIGHAWYRVCGVVWIGVVDTVRVGSSSWYIDGCKKERELLSYMIGVNVNADLVQTGLLCHKRGDGLDDHTAHRHPGILLHARCSLVFAWPFMVSSAARSCRALQRSFTLPLARLLLLFWLLCCTLKLPSFSPHPPVFTLSFLWLACLLTTSLTPSFNTAYH